MTKIFKSMRQQLVQSCTKSPPAPVKNFLPHPLARKQKYYFFSFTSITTLCYLRLYHSACLLVLFQTVMSMLLQWVALVLALCHECQTEQSVGWFWCLTDWVDLPSKKVPFDYFNHLIFASHDMTFWTE